MTVGWKSLAGAALAASLLLAGCGPKEPAPSETPSAVPAPPPPAPDAPKTDAKGAPADAKVPATDAKAIFTANCAKCHKLADIPGGRAPDLTKIGGEKDATWIEAHIKDPKTHKPDSKMPPFGGKLSDADIKTVAAMLAGMK